MSGLLKRFCLVLFTVVLAVAVWVCWSLLFSGSRVIVSPQTTYITEPLGEDGLPDYATAMLDRHREGVTPENNGAIPLWQAVWPGELEPAYWDLVCNELGMKVPAGRGSLMPVENEAIAAWLLARWEAEEGDVDRGGVDWEAEARSASWHLEYLAYGQPWTSDSLPPLAEWLEASAPGLELVHEAAARPRFYSPKLPLLLDPPASMFAHDIVVDPIPRPQFAVDPVAHIRPLRLAARALIARAMNSTAHGRFESAWQDIHACFRLSEHSDNCELMIWELIAIALAGMACDATLVLLEQDELPEDLARQILADLMSLPMRSTMLNSINHGERMMTLDEVTRLFTGRPSGLVDGVGSRLAMTALDTNLILRGVNEWYDRSVEAGRLSPWAERQRAVEALADELDRKAAARGGPVSAMHAMLSRRVRSETVLEVLLGLCMPTIHVALEAEDRTNTQLMLTRVAAALAVYRAENGQYPKSLEALTPGLFHKLPVDSYHEKPLVYQRLDAGYLITATGHQRLGKGYLLYSLGRNGEDDGGSNTDRESAAFGYRMDQLEEWPPRIVRSLDADASANRGDDESMIKDELVGRPPPMLPAADDQAIRSPRLKDEIPGPPDADSSH